MAPSLRPSPGCCPGPLLLLSLPRREIDHGCESLAILIIIKIISRIFEKTAYAEHAQPAVFFCREKLVALLPKIPVQERDDGNGGRGVIFSGRSADVGLMMGLDDLFRRISYPFPMV